MTKHEPIEFDERAFRQGAVHKLGTLVERMLHIAIAVVYPRKDGWGFVRFGKGDATPEYCRVIQSTKEGAKQCKMCHILMSVAACRSGATEQRCHTGTSVLVSPIANAGEEGMAILSSCIYARDSEKFDWDTVAEHGRRLGLDVATLREAYEKLPVLSDEQVALARGMMEAAGEAVRELRAKQILEARLRGMTERPDPQRGMVDAVEKELKRYFADRREETRGLPVEAGQTGASSTLIHVIVDLVRRKPNLPYTVGSLAAAARMTPNHFSALFRNVEGRCFSDFLTERRIAMAKDCLSDLTLSVGEVAAQVGYDDPGYFARRFKQQVGASPREWREGLAQRSRRRRTA